MGGQDERDPPEVPDLDLPVRSVRGSAVPHPAPVAPAPPPAVDTGADAFEDLEIVRGGYVPESTSGAPPSGHVGSRASVPAQRPSLELAYRRLDAEARPPPRGPSNALVILAGVVPVVTAAASAATLVRFVHRPGRSVLGVLPRAFDGTSTVQSGGVSLVALVLAIALGWIGMKSRPRSFAMIGAAAMLLVASLAMVTVTLVSTEESGAPPDGALLIPYVLPAALLLLGFGLIGRGRPLILAGGGRRAAALAVAALGGALLFAAVELSSLSARLPTLR